MELMGDVEQFGYCYEGFMVYEPSQMFAKSEIALLVIDINSKRG